MPVGTSNALIRALHHVQEKNLPEIKGGAIGKYLQIRP
jgi:hypothetical protein